MTITGIGLTGFLPFDLVLQAISGAQLVGSYVLFAFLFIGGFIFNPDRFTGIFS